jgi:3-hydroxyisobutyrate dehydrogenase-like beta-hydroxyacid dehydrogenase
VETVAFYGAGMLGLGLRSSIVPGDRELFELVQPALEQMTGSLWYLGERAEAQRF